MARSKKISSTHDFLGKIMQKRRSKKRRFEGEKTNETISKVFLEKVVKKGNFFGEYTCV